MVKWAKRILLTLAILLTIAIVSAAVGVYLYKRTPDWYAPRIFTPAQIEVAARAAEQKMVQTYNWAAEARARESSRVNNTQSPRVATQPFSGTTITFTADELNAFFQKWNGVGNWQASYGKYLDRPAIVLHDQRLILAAEVKDLGAILSVHFKPSLDSDGRLRLQLERVLAGRLPLPMSMWSDYRKSLERSIQRNLPRWQRQAKMDPGGAANSPTVSAAMSKLLLAVLHDESADPVILLPLDDKHFLPTKVSGVSITDNALNVAVEPMTETQRREFLVKVREPYAAQTAMTP